MTRSSGPDHRVAIAVLGGHVDLDGDARPLLDRVAADQPGVVGGAAGDDDDPLEALQKGVVDGRIDRGQPQIDPPPPRCALADGLGDGVGLLVDLLEHEALIALLLRGVGIPVDLRHLALDDLAGGAVDGDALGAQRDDLVVVEVLDLPGLAQERGNRRGDELLRLAVADDQRALAAGAHQQPRLVRGHGHERVMAAHLGVGGADGLHEVAGVVVGHQVGDDLGVGLGGEHGAVLHEARLEGDVVLDDPVDDDVDAVGGVEVRVGVLLGHAPVSRPAGVTDARPRPIGDGGGRGHWRGRRRLSGPLGVAPVDGRPQHAQVAHGAHGVDPVTVQDGDARAVIAAIFELFEAREEQGPGLAGADVSDDAAHGRVLLGRAGRFSV